MDYDTVSRAVKALSVLSRSAHCPVCLEGLKFPHRTNCGHTFCKMCLDNHMVADMDENTESSSPRTNNIKKCPICYKKLTQRGVVADKMLGKIASSILELVHNFELDVGQTFDLDQVRSKLNINKREAKTPIKVNKSRPLIKSARARAAEDSKSLGKRPPQKVSVQETEVFAPNTSSTLDTSTTNPANEPMAGLPDFSKSRVGQKSTSRKLELVQKEAKKKTTKNITKTCNRDVRVALDRIDDPVEDNQSDDVVELPGKDDVLPKNVDSVSIVKNTKIVADDPTYAIKNPVGSSSGNRVLDCDVKTADEIPSYPESMNATPDRAIPDKIKETKLNSIKSDLKKISALLTTLDKSPAGTGGHQRGGSNAGSRPTTPVMSSLTLKQRRIENDIVGDQVETSTSSHSRTIEKEEDRVTMSSPIKHAEQPNQAMKLSPIRSDKKVNKGSKPSPIQLPKEASKSSPSPTKQNKEATKLSSIQPAQANKPRIQFLWRGMKKADTFLHPPPISRPKKISFLKLGRLSSAFLDDSNSDVDVSQFMLDQDDSLEKAPLGKDTNCNRVPENGDLEREVSENPESLEKEAREEIAVGLVSPSQDMASRSILSQHPGVSHLVDDSDSQSSNDFAFFGAQRDQTQIHKNESKPAGYQKSKDESVEKHQSSQLSIKQSTKRRRLPSSSDFNDSFNLKNDEKRLNSDIKISHVEAQKSKTVSNFKLSKRDASKRSLIDDPDSDSSDSEEKRHTNKRQRHVISSDDSDDDLVQSTQDLERELNLLKEKEREQLQTGRKEQQQKEEADKQQKEAEQKLETDKQKKEAEQKEEKENVSESSEGEDMFNDTPQKIRPLKTVGLASNQRKKAQVTPLSEKNKVIPFVSQSPEADFPIEAEVEDSSQMEAVVEENFPYCVISTGLVKRKRDQFLRFLTAFDILTTKGLDDDVTHVVIDINDDNCAVRTLKYIQALSMGKTIVSFTWVMRCLDSNKILPTLEFEPKDTNGELGPQRARIYFLNRLGNKLFQNYSVCMLGMFVNEVPKIELEHIVTRLGGQIYKNMSDLAANRGRGGRKRLAVVESSKVQNAEVNRIFPTFQVAVVSKEWILDSVGAFQLKDIFPYVQGSVKKEELIGAGYNVNIVKSASHSENRAGQKM